MVFDPNINLMNPNTRGGIGYQMSVNIWKGNMLLPNKPKSRRFVFPIRALADEDHGTITNRKGFKMNLIRSRHILEHKMNVCWWTRHLAKPPR